MYTTTSLQAFYLTLTNNNDSTNSALGLQLMNDSIRRICAYTDWDFLQKSKTALTVAAQQFYALPYDYDSLITCSILNGSTLYIPKECPDREFWDQLNQQTTFQSNFPEWYYIYQGQIGFYPMPSTSALTINLNYRRTIVDLTAADYTTGSIVSVANGGTAVVGSGTSWTAPMAGRYIKITPTDVAATSGDGVWYQIASVGSGTTLTLVKPYNGTALTASTATYTIGQAPIIPEAYHDLPAYEAAQIFYTTINPDVNRAQLFKERVKDLFTHLTKDHGSKTLDPVIHDAGANPILNLNNFLTLP